MVGGICARFSVVDTLGWSAIRTRRLLLVVSKEGPDICLTLKGSTYRKGCRRSPPMSGPSLPMTVDSLLVVPTSSLKVMPRVAVVTIERRAELRLPRQVREGETT